jgi:RNA polymerase sigma-70 factor (family 1)
LHVKNEYDMAEERTIEQLNQWDKSAVDWLYDRFYRVLVLYVVDLIGYEEAQDVVQDVFLRLVQLAPQFESHASLKAYLYNATHNKAISLIRQRNRNEGHVVNIEEAKEGEFDKADEEDEDVYHKEEVYQHLFESIDRLPQRQREVFLLAMKGKRNAEIAEQLGIAVNTVKVMKRRGFATLRKDLSPDSLILLLTII